MNMAAEEFINSRQDDIEPVVSRWILDYYFSQALECFQKEQQEDFLDIRHILDRVLHRPIEVTDTTQIKIRVLQFLARIYEGESPEYNPSDKLQDLKYVSFESPDLSPLESALALLENIHKEFDIPQQDYDSVCTSLKEMIVVVFIKNKEFDKAEQAVKNHFPKPMVDKKAIFMGLIRKKSQSHELIDQIDFQQFKENMLDFCRRICPFGVPLLCKAAKIYYEKRELTEPDDNAADLDEESEPGPSSSPQNNTSSNFVPQKQPVIPMSRLKAVYKDLATGSDEKSFAQLTKEVKEEQTQRNLSLQITPSPTMGTSQNPEQEMSFQRASGSPMEGCPADQPPEMDVDPQVQAGSLSKTVPKTRKRQLYTVARLVVEPDSQGSSQCTTSSQETETVIRTKESHSETEARTEEPRPAVVVPDERNIQNPVTDHEIPAPTRKQPRRSTRKYSKPKQISDSEEEESESSLNTPVKPCLKPASDSTSKKNRTSPPAKQLDCTPKAARQTQAIGSGKLKQLSPRSEEEPSSFKTPIQPPFVQLTSPPSNRDRGNADEFSIMDSSLDSSPSPFPFHPLPKTSSTPHKDSSAEDPGPSKSKWKRLVSSAMESKEIWIDEDLYFDNKKRSVSTIESSSSKSHKRKMWTEAETKKLKEGVEKFGEGNWSKIRAHYSFKDRTSVNLKDRWRTMKKCNMV